MWFKGHVVEILFQNFPLIYKTEALTIQPEFLEQSIWQSHTFLHFLLNQNSFMNALQNNYKTIMQVLKVLDRLLQGL